jgi:hypothetical protein
MRLFDVPLFSVPGEQAIDPGMAISFPRNGAPLHLLAEPGHQFNSCFFKASTRSSMHVLTDTMIFNNIDIFKHRRLIKSYIPLIMFLGDFSSVQCTLSPPSVYLRNMHFPTASLNLPPFI